MNAAADYLRAVLAAFRNDVVPELNSDMARHRAELIDFVLTRLVARAGAPELWREDYWHKVGAALDASPLAALERSDQAIAQSLKTILADVSHGRDGAAPPRQARDAITHAIAQAESTYRDRLEASVRDESKSAKAVAKDHVGSKMTTENITGYLRRRFPDYPGIRATAVTPIPGGRSKGTTLFELEGHPSFPREVILRQDLNADVGGLSVTYEYPLLETLWQHDLKVPQPLWLEAQDNELGGAFSTFARVPGKPGGTLFSMNAPADTARDAAKFFGRLHALDIDRNDIRAKLMWGDDREPVRAMLDFFYAKWTAIKGEPNVLVEASFLKLYDRLDTVEPRAALVHGDSSYHNMLIHDGRLSAVLDWEFAHAGDPAEDLLGSEHFTTQVLPWTEFIKIYRDNGGQEISRERFQFFALWRSLRFAISTAAAGYVFSSGVNRDLRVATIGFNSFPRLLQDVAHQLAAMD